MRTLLTLWLAAIVAALGSGATAADAPNPLAPSVPPAKAGSPSPRGPAAGAKTPHPLAPVLSLAEASQHRLASEVRDYTATIITRERRDGRLKPYVFLSAKVRNARPGAEGDTPFSVYFRCLKPRSMVGREVLYVQGRDAGKMLVRRGGTRLPYVTTYLDPQSRIALQENRYPVTDIGFVRLIERLVEVVREDMHHGECSVAFYKNARIGDRPCTRVVVEHPTPRPHFRFARAVVFVDRETQLPLAYASYTWPREQGGDPLLMEEYIYTDVRLNVGLTDRDFDRENPEYAFLKRDPVIAADR